MTWLSNGIGSSGYRFGDYQLDRRTLELRKSGEKIKLAPQPAAVLRLLASRRGELVSRDEIRRELWGVSCEEPDGEAPGSGQGKRGEWAGAVMGRPEVEARAGCPPA